MADNHFVTPKISTTSESLNATLSPSCRLHSDEGRDNMTFYEYNLTAWHFSTLPPSEEERATITALYVALIVCAAVSNVGLLLWVFITRLLGVGDARGAVDMYSTSLAASDLLSAFLTMPISMVAHINNQDWRAGMLHLSAEAANVLCKLLAYVQSVVATCSICVVVAMSVDRYVAICHPFMKYKLAAFRKTILTATIISIWIFSALFAFRDAYYYRLPRDTRHEIYYDEIIELIKVEYKFVPNATVLAAEHRLVIARTAGVHCAYDLVAMCTEHAATESTQAYVVCQFMLFFVLPTIVFVFCYGSMVHVLWVRRPVGDIRLSASTAGCDDRKAQTSGRKKNALALLGLAAAYTSFYSPYFVYVTYAAYRWRSKSIDDVDPEDFHSNNTLATVKLLYYCTTMINPIFYVIASRSLKVTVRDLIAKLCPSESGSSRQRTSGLRSSAPSTNATACPPSPISW